LVDKLRVVSPSSIRKDCWWLGINWYDDRR
jgi:hypothetical protein